MVLDGVAGVGSATPEDNVVGRRTRAAHHLQRHNYRAAIAGQSEVCVPRSSKMTIESDVWVHFTQEQLAGYNKVCSDVEAGPR